MPTDNAKLANMQGVSINRRSLAGLPVMIMWLIVPLAT
jgi:hypothetical protein